MKWIISKIPGLKNILTPLQQKLAPVKQLFDTWASGISKYAKGGATQNITTHGYMGSADDIAKGLGKKTGATIDKLATKKAVGAGTKAYHTVKSAKETLKNLIAKYKLSADTLLQLNPGLTKNPNAPLPINTKVRVA